MQSRLLTLAGIFLFLYSAAFTLAPAARLHSWNVALNWQHWLGFIVWLVFAILAHLQTTRRLPNRDPYLLPVAALLTGWGLLTIWRLYPYYGLRQTLWLAIAAALLIWGLRLSPELSFLKRYKYLWLSGGLLLTALTLLFGTNPTGANSQKLWLGCCGVYFQPSEPLKILLVVYLAAYLASGINGNNAFSFRLLPLLAPTLIMTGLAMLLLIVQRDLGTVSIFLFLYAAITYVASGRKLILLFGGLAILIAAIAGYALFDVVRLRVDAWLNPWLDPSGRSYQIVQSLLAVANGGIFGRGPGVGSPGLVPVPHSDFIFTAIAEESGLFGTLALLTLLAILTNRGLRIALAAPDAYRRYLAAGLTAFLVGQSVLIIAGNLRLLPLTGVTLPFVSYGGSSLLVSFFSLLFLLLISDQASSGKEALPQTGPYLQLGAFLVAGLIAAALAAGWWSVYRAPALVSRTDDPRRVVADRFVYRGAILDRSNNPLAETQGKPGSYTRKVTYPPLSSVIGYTNPIYGQSGLEASLDDSLRGVLGYPGMDMWWYHLLYGQPPPGLDARTSLDLNVQRAADNLLANHSGALVLLNSDTGEILAMGSHPGFDANLLGQNWDSLIQDPASPLLDRASQGIYPAGALQSLLFPKGSSDPNLDKNPKLRIPAAKSIALEDGSLHITPLQAALAAASLNSNGKRPAPILVLAVRNPKSGWVIQAPQEDPVQAISPNEARDRAEKLAVTNLSIWQSMAIAPNGAGKTITWYIGGTLPEWKGAPLSIAVLLEENNPLLAEQIGQAVLKSSMQP